LKVVKLKLKPILTVYKGITRDSWLT